MPKQRQVGKTSFKEVSQVCPKEKVAKKASKKSFIVPKLKEVYKKVSKESSSEMVAKKSVTQLSCMSLPPPKKKGQKRRQSSLLNVSKEKKVAKKSFKEVPQVCTQGKKK